MTLSRGVPVVCQLINRAEYRKPVSIRASLTAEQSCVFDGLALMPLLVSYITRSIQDVEEEENKTAELHRVLKGFDQSPRKEISD